jgi:hypothetical protein
MKLLVLLLVLTVAACAGKSKAIAVGADQTINTILLSVQAGADRLTTAGVITPQTRMALSPHLLRALQLGDAYNRAVRAGTVAEAIPPLLEALRVLRLQLGQLIPAASNQGLVADVDRALGLVPTGGS